MEKRDTIKNWTRERICIGCGKMERVRKDSKALSCARCNSRIQIEKAHEARSAKARDRLKSCPICGTLHNPNYITCSLECRVAYTRRIELICETCHQPFVMRASALPPINMTTNAKGRFCSKDCYSIWQRTQSR